MEPAAAASSADAHGPTGVEVLIAQLAARGVRRIFGVPGGECSLDVIDAARRWRGTGGDAGNGNGIEFVLARSESAAAIMAAVHAELTGSLGVVLTTRGPGLANAVNGIAYAALDRAPLLLIADGWEDDEAFVSYQRFDQMKVLEPLVKGSLRLNGAAPLHALGPLFDLALAAPMGPVYLEVTATGMRAPARSHSMLWPTRSATASPPPPMEDILEARDLVARAERPVIIAGLQAREQRATGALRKLVTRWKCPVFTTYKGKGVIADDDPHLIGHYLGGPGETPLMSGADLIILVGADPIEFPPKRWPWHAPVLELAAHPFERQYVMPRQSLTGDLADALAGIESAARAGGWKPEQLIEAKSDIRGRALSGFAIGISPQRVIEAVRIALAPDAVITVDAGAHMLPAMALTEARRPRQVLISKGLATMAFALPAAIGAALADPGQRVVALIGDGGLMMCAGELATAAQAGCRLTVVVFNDSRLTLIEVKQHRRQLPLVGVICSPTDFSQVAEGFGCKGLRVERARDLVPALVQAMAGEGPVVVDVVVDPTPYREQIAALRG